MKPKMIPCPRCKELTEFSKVNPFRPFCSSLCKNEDIVCWAEENYRIPTNPRDEDENLPTAEDLFDFDDGSSNQMS